MPNLEEEIKHAQETANATGKTQYVVVGYDDRDNLDFVTTEHLQFEGENYFARCEPQTALSNENDAQGNKWQPVISSADRNILVTHQELNSPIHEAYTK